MWITVIAFGLGEDNLAKAIWDANEVPNGDKE